MPKPGPCRATGPASPPGSWPTSWTSGSPGCSACRCWWPRGWSSYLLTGPPLHLPVLPNWLDATAGATIAVAYLTFSWAATGRSVGKQVAGLRVVDRAGRRLSVWRSFARAVLYVLFPAGLLWVLASRRNASLQDLIVRTVVVYDWAYHPPDQPSPTSDGGSPRPARSPTQA